MGEPSEDMIVVGRISGLYGVRGWVKVYSYTEPRENILEYPVWHLQVAGDWQRLELADGRRHGKGVVAHLATVDDRETARALIGLEISIPREQLPEPGEGEYYWADLIGLKVVTVDGSELGEVDHLMETGANDVLVVKGERERLIPFIQGDVVLEVDLEQGVLRVDWDPEF